MQIFLPLSDLQASLKVLDRSRMMKQRVETIQILRGILASSGGFGDEFGKGVGWTNHPATVMVGYHGLWLCRYLRLNIAEATRRGYDSTKSRAHAVRLEPALRKLGHAPYAPDWFGNEEFHRSHQSNLIRKDPEFYRPKFPLDVPDNLEYVWPTCHCPICH